MASKITQPPDLNTLLNGLNPETVVRLVNVGATLADGRYLHWDDLRWREPPEGLTAEQWWAGTRLARHQSSRRTDLVDIQGVPFSYSLVDPILKSLHNLDLRATGRSAAPAAVLDRTTRNRYKVRGLIEEALSSSQLEGASTTRVVAKQMLRSGRSPRDRSERMIFNNFHAITFIKDAASEALTPKLLLEMHALLTDGTMDDQRDCGRFQQPGEPRVSVVDWRSGETVFTPPPAEQIPERIERMCAFANDGENSFTHPLVKAVLLHFWLAYIHPFFDGNGRAARAMFYWSALRAGYWLTEYVSISEIVLKAPGEVLPRLPPHRDRRQRLDLLPDPPTRGLAKGFRGVGDLCRQDPRAHASRRTDRRRPARAQPQATGPSRTRPTASAVSLHIPEP